MCTGHCRSWNGTSTTSSTRPDPGRPHPQPLHRRLPPRGLTPERGVLAIAAVDLFPTCAGHHRETRAIGVGFRSQGVVTPKLSTYVPIGWAAVSLPIWSVRMAGTVPTAVE